MSSPTEQDGFRTGCPRAQEWHGLWKAHPEDATVTDLEWGHTRSKLREWLSARYLVRYSNDFPPSRWDRHCWVEGDFVKPERTLTIVIGVAEVLSISFLKFVQEWLRDEAPAWRVAVPIDNTEENLIYIYPTTIKINERAEAALDEFVKAARPLLHREIEFGRFGRKFFSLKPKPHPPLPNDEG